MPKISQIDGVPCQAEVRILQKITLKEDVCCQATICQLKKQFLSDPLLLGFVPSRFCFHCSISVLTRLLKSFKSFRLS